jgi:ABC-2 type transport system permease protein
MKAGAMHINKTLVRREFWENRSLWIVPAVVAGILTVLSVYMLIAVLIGHNQTVNNVDFANGAHFQIDQMPDFRDTDSEGIYGFLHVLTLGLGAMFSFIMQIVVFFYLLDSLYADRRDRSILFWRSMPVSDARTVLAKLATAIISVTAITFVITVAFELVLVVLGLILGSVMGTHPFAVLAYPGAFLSSWLLLAYGLIVSAVWYLPFYGWYMLASSWARKAPFLWALLVPLGIMGAEGWVFHTTHFARMIWGYKERWLSLAFNFDPLHVKHSMDDMNVGPLFSIGNLGELMASPLLWIGLAVAAAFVCGTIWLRRKRNEI